MVGFLDISSKGCTQRYLAGCDGSVNHELNGRADVDTYGTLACVRIASLQTQQVPFTNDGLEFVIHRLIW